ncbi:MAG: MBL fold metallo-hydrolase, partial [Dehalococcoidales bacterium]|nr:MBL fold metallo-hydrolase [Dehalococcoidales bacterium]
MKIRLIGAHNMESINIRPACALIDDVLAIDAGGLTAGLTLQEQTRIKAILLTHHHYDHIKDVVMIGATFHDNESTITFYGTQEVKEAVEYLFNFPGKLYKNLLAHPPEDPVIKFKLIEPGKEFKLHGYKILPLAVKHSVPTVGFYITSPSGKKLFYTGDTGPGLDDCWRQVSPDLLIIENTA